MIPEAAAQLAIAAVLAGEHVPPGVWLIGDREPTEAELAHGRSLEPLAAACLEGEETNA